MIPSFPKDDDALAEAKSAGEERPGGSAEADSAEPKRSGSILLSPERSGSMRRKSSVQFAEGEDGRVLAQKLEYEPPEGAAPEAPPFEATPAPLSPPSPSLSQDLSSRLSGRSPRLSNRPAFAEETPYDS